MCHKGIFFSEIVVFLVRKGSYTTFNIVKIREIWEKKGKIRKTWSMTKKRSSEILVREKIFRPPKLGARSPPLGPCLPFYPTYTRNRVVLYNRPADLALFQ